MSDETIRSQLAKLPPRAVAAFASRCARRVRPLAKELDEEEQLTIEHMIELAESVAQGAGSSSISIADSIEEFESYREDGLETEAAQGNLASAATYVALEAAKSALSAQVDDVQSARASALDAASSFISTVEEAGSGSTIGQFAGDLAKDVATEIVQGDLDQLDTLFSKALPAFQGVTNWNSPQLLSQQALIRGGGSGGTPATSVCHTRV